MEYKLVNPLRTRHVEPWAEYVFSEKIVEHSQPMASALAVRKAVELKWFDGEQPNVDELEPLEVIKLSTMVWSGYSESMGFDAKNLPGRSQTTPKV